MSNFEKAKILMERITIMKEEFNDEFQDYCIELGALVGHNHLLFHKDDLERRTERLKTLNLRIKHMEEMLKKYAGFY